MSRIDNSCHNWERRAKALDMFLGGMSRAAIGRALGCSRGNAGIMVKMAAHQLAYRLFYGVPYHRGGTGAYRVAHGPHFSLEEMIEMAKEGELRASLKAVGGWEPADELEALEEFLECPTK